jgi:hypothetical protein
MNSVADPDPISSGFLMFGSGISNEKKSRSGMNIPEYFPESLETICMLKYSLVWIVI